MNDLPARIDKVRMELDEAIRAFTTDGSSFDDRLDPALATPILRAFAASIVKDCAGKVRDSKWGMAAKPYYVDELDTYAKEIENA